MKLVIVESPTKAKTLSKILGKNYVVEASMGHIRDLPKSGLAIDVEKDFQPDYVVSEKGKKVVTKLKKALKDAEEVVLATDPDREGEAIAWHLYHLLSSSKAGKQLKFNRVTFHELTPEAVLDAFKTSNEINMNLVDSQQARRVLDRLVGYKLSPLLWKKVRFGLSAGRVQSAAVRLIVERERERNSFVPEESWSITAELVQETQQVAPFEAILDKILGKKIKITTEEQCQEMLKSLQEVNYTVDSIKVVPRKKAPYPPFKTSTLQQSMANVYGTSASKTMSGAQKLFEQGLITYHRTDSLSLSPAFVQEARAYITSRFGKDYLPESPIFYKTKSKNAQEAHEAIRPTNLGVAPDDKKIAKLGQDAQRGYSLLWNRSIECQMMPAIFDQTTVVVKTSDSHEFKASGSVIVFQGWLALGSRISTNPDEAEESRVLPVLKEKEKLGCSRLLPKQHFTQPPARYSDASLIKALEELGIGRPSTYASIINTIQARGYVFKETRYFIPTDVSYVVIDLLVEHVPVVTDYDFTAKMESVFDDIASGTALWVPIIRDFYEPFEKILAQKDKELSKREVTNLGETEETCPECKNHKLVIKLGKYGKFLSCANYPDCSFARPLDGDPSVSENGELKEFGACPNCDGGKFHLKKGRFGNFLACSNYPKCKTTQPYLEKIGLKCPKCVNGEVVVKKAKGRTFYGCSAYPDCDYSSWKNPLAGAGKKGE